MTATLSAPYTFAGESPRRRVYVAAQPISFCVDGVRLFRYTNYGWLTAQPLAAALPATSPDRQLLADDVAAGVVPFSVLAPSLTRNNIVALSLALDGGSDTVVLQQSVHLRYVP